MKTRSWDGALVVFSACVEDFIVGVGWWGGCSKERREEQARLNSVMIGTKNHRYKS